MITLMGTPSLLLKMTATVEYSCLGRNGDNGFRDVSKVLPAVRCD